MRAEVSDLSLFNSYLQTGAWQGRSSTSEVNEAVWRRAGMRTMCRQDQKRSRYSSTNSLLFIPALAPGEREVSDFQGVAGGGDAELRPEMQLGRSRISGILFQTSPQLFQGFQRYNLKYNNSPPHPPNSDHIPELCLPVSQ